MGIFDLVLNTVEGAVQVAVNTAKVSVGVVVGVVDDGKTVSDAIDGIEDGLEKIGKAEPQEKDSNHD